MKMEKTLYVHWFLPKSCDNSSNDAEQNLTCYVKADSKFVTPTKEYTFHSFQNCIPYKFTTSRVKYVYVCVKRNFLLKL